MILLSPLGYIPYSGDQSMIRTTTLGYPRIGRNRELKRACESYWNGTIGSDELLSVGATLRQAHWQTQHHAGIDLIPVNDFSLYDQVLDAIALIGAIPERYQWTGNIVDLPTYFAMARGIQQAHLDASAMEMTKWFNTNYHYIVPEWSPKQHFHLASTKLFDEFEEAIRLGIPAKPVLIGPLTLLLLGTTRGKQVDLYGDTLTGIVSVYTEVIERLAAMGATWIQFDEPCLVQERTTTELTAVREIYQTFAAIKGTAKLLLSTYFGQVGENYQTLLELAVDGIGLDLVNGPENVHLLSTYGFPEDKVLVAGLVSGRNIWRTNLSAALDQVDRLTTQIAKEQIIIAPSSSLLHVPYDAQREHATDAEIRAWLAFAEQKLEEVVLLGRALQDGRTSITDALAKNQSIIDARVNSAKVSRPEVQERLSTTEITQRLPYEQREILQKERFHLPLLPTTTIGSFPQTAEVRQKRRQFESRALSEREYHEFLKRAIADAITRQEEIGLDVLVHGEFERNDMVQYFGEQLSGIVFTQHGWVQSYGSRYVRPPIIFGDVVRPKPMTVQWSIYAQSLTQKPVKGMLTGPITILHWSFVRDDQPLATTCRQLALAIHDEVLDLERAGIGIIQIDEPALREGLPLRREQWQAYLDWAVACFHFAVSGIQDTTQIHTHMCYANFQDIIEAIRALDADVISIECSRSQMDLLRAFATSPYPNAIGPGVYDIHSPRIPTQEEIEHLLTKAFQSFPIEHVWVNPDCGLKTRTWTEVTQSLTHMVAAARTLRIQRANTTA